MKYQYVTEYTNGFDVSLSDETSTNTYRVSFESTPKGGITHISTRVLDSWDYELEIPQDDLEIIRKLSFDLFQVQF